MLEAAVATGVEKFVYTSSGAAYGYHPDNPPLLFEDDALRGNEAFGYSWHKRLVDVARAIGRATQQRRRQVVIGGVGRLSYWVSRLAPAVYERLMRHSQRLSVIRRAVSEQPGRSERRSVLGRRRSGHSRGLLHLFSAA